MKSFLSILFLAKKYLRYALLNLVFNFFSILFSLFSLGMVIPFLGLLFNTQKPVLVRPDFKLNAEGIEQWFSYFISGFIADENGMVSEDGRAKGLMVIVCMIVGIFFLKNLTRYLAMYFIAPLRNGIIHDLRERIFKKILALPISYYSDERKGDIMARISGDVQEVEWAILNSLEVVFREPFSILVFLTSLLILSPQLTLFALILLPISGLIIGQIGKSLRKNSVDLQNSTGEMMALTEETLGGIQIIKAFFAGELFLGKFKKLNFSLRKLSNRIIRKRDLASPLSEFLGAVVLAALIWFGGKMVLDTMAGKISPGLSAASFIAYIAIFSQIITPAKAFSSSIYYIQKGIASAERINMVLNAKETIQDAPDALTLDHFEKEIAFQNVRFSYSNSEVLKGISFTIKKGEVVALVGPSGAGKSSITNLLCRFYDVDSGSITMDGIEISSIQQSSLRQLIALVPQHSILFNDSIRNNIALGNPEASEKAVEDAAKVANAFEFIDQFPDKFNTGIGDNGNKLSGGQRQRVCIARAVLNNPPILVMDEATSALDTESERLVQEALGTMLTGRTALIIAHRLSTVQHATKILVLNEGQIVEEGNHLELMEANGLYRKMIEMQGL
ncbi:MAG: ABC transporter ATP-binding protein/permease [Bacteroidia bacterium]|nr:ABC transporter ATP-binding protein/permease [Bacteroidia bacterium]